MTTTTAWLQSKTGAKVAFVLAFDGYNLLLTTTDDTTGIATAWSGTDWTTVKAGLEIPSSIAQDIALFDPKIKPDTMSFSIVDHDGTIRTNLLRNRSSGANVTLLDETFAVDTTSIKGTHDPGFASSGDIYVGHNRVAYTTLTGSTFSGLSIKNTLFNRSGGTGLLNPMTIGDAKVRTSRQQISSLPAHWYNRTVALYMHHYENGAWSTKANALLLWAGRIKEVRDGRGDGTIEIVATNIKERLFDSVLEDQFRGRLAEGIYVPAAAGRFVLQWEDSGATPTDAALSADLSGTDAQWTWQDATTAINEQLETWRSGSSTSSTHRWYMETRQTAEGVRVAMVMERSSAVTSNRSTSHAFEFGLSNTLLHLLGFTKVVSAIPNQDKPTRFVLLQQTSTTKWEAMADEPPLLYPAGVPINEVWWHFAGEKKLSFSETEGTWLTQPTFPTGVNDSGLGEGIIQYGRLKLLVSQDDATTFTIRGRIGLDGLREETAAATADEGRGVDQDKLTSERGIRLGDDVQPPEAYQVWWERGKMGTIMLQCMLSTGVSAHNNATYDVYAKGFGLGIPHDLIDISSFERLEEDYELVVEKPTPFRELLEPVLASEGRYIIWKDGAITLGHPGFDLGSVDNIIELTEANKGSPTDRASISYSAEGLVNVVQFEAEVFGTKLVVTLPNTPSVDEFGARTVSIKGRGILDADKWAEYVAAPVLAYFGRPVGIIERTYNHLLLHMAPGDIVKLTDNYLVDPNDGTRGITGLAAFVLGTNFDFRSGSGSVRLAFLPEHDASKYAKYAPSAHVDDTAANGGRISTTGSTATLRCYANRFSRSGDDADASFFSAGDQVVIRSIEASSTSWVTDIASISSNDIEVNDVLTGYDTTGATKYIIEYDDYSTVDAGQQGVAYIADDANMGISTAGDANLWAGTSNNEFLDYVSTVTYTRQFARPESSIATAGEPLSSRKLIMLLDSLNNLMAYRTRHPLISQMFSTAKTTTNTTGTLVYGPVRCPLYGASPNSTARRDLRCTVLTKTSSGLATATAKILSSDKPPRGTATNSLSYPGRTSSVTFSTVGTSYTWKTEQTLTPIVARDAVTPYTWLWVELNGTGGSTASLQGISVWEEPLS